MEVGRVGVIFNITLLGDYLRSFVLGDLAQLGVSPEKRLVLCVLGLTAGYKE